MQPDRMEDGFSDKLIRAIASKLKDVNMKVREASAFLVYELTKAGAYLIALESGVH